MATRYTLRYKSKEGTPVVLYNLLRLAVSEITGVQAHLGSTDFEHEAQPHNYSQWEIDLKEGRDGNQ